MCQKPGLYNLYYAFSLGIPEVTNAGISNTINYFCVFLQKVILKSDEKMQFSHKHEAFLKKVKMKQ